MKNSFIKFSGALLIAGLAFTSCSDDDDNHIPADLTVAITTIGHSDAVPHVHAGEELHLEAEILAMARIASVKLEIHNEQDPSAPEITMVFSDYNNLVNATLHKHILIPASQPAGDYHLHLTVTDLNGNTSTAESELEIFAADSDNGITILLSELGTGTVGSSHVTAGQELHIEGTIETVHPVVSVSMEIHNATAPAIEATFTGYAGQTNINLHEHLLIPASQPAGHYHFHLTVIDDEGNSETIEYDLTIQ